MHLHLLTEESNLSAVVCLWEISRSDLQVHAIRSILLRSENLHTQHLHHQKAFVHFLRSRHPILFAIDEFEFAKTIFKFLQTSLSLYEIRPILTPTFLCLNIKMDPQAYACSVRFAYSCGRVPVSLIRTSIHEQSFSLSHFQNLNLKWMEMTIPEIHNLLTMATKAMLTHWFCEASCYKFPN